MGTGITREGWETGDPGYHPRCRFLGGPEMNMLAENKKGKQLCPQQWEERTNTKGSHGLSFVRVTVLWAMIELGKVTLTIQHHTNNCNHMLFYTLQF